MAEYEKLRENLIAAFDYANVECEQCSGANICDFNNEDCMFKRAADAIEKLQSESVEKDKRIAELQFDDGLLKIRLDMALSELNGARNCESFYTRKIEELQAEIERLKKQLEVATLLMVDTMKYLDGDCAVCDNGTRWCESCEYKDKWKFIFHDRYEAVKQWRDHDVGDGDANG